MPSAFMKFVSVIHKEIMDKFLLLQEIADLVNEPTKKSDILALRQKYILETIGIFCQYSKAINLAVQYELNTRFVENILTINLAQEINVIRNDLAKKVVAKSHAETVLHSCDLININYDIQKQDYKCCPECNSKMIIREHKGDSVCTKCSYSVNLCGVISEEKGSEVPIKKNGNAETMKHLKKQFEHLFAHIPPQIQDTDYAKIEKWLKTNVNKHITETTATDYRLCLKEVKLTKLNVYIPYIMKRCSKIEIVDLSYEQNNRFWAIAELVVSALDKFSSNSDDKLKYYVYIIIKILEIILKDTPLLLKRIKQCAYLKSEKTTIKQDQVWEKICKQISIEFIKTKL